MALGIDVSVARMQDALSGRGLAEVPRAQRRPAAEALETCAADSDRRRVLARAYLSGDYTMKAIDEHFEVHYASVSRAVRRGSLKICRVSQRLCDFRI